MSVCLDQVSDISASRTGNFELLLRGATKRAYALAIELTSNRSDAEDLLQDATIKAWKGFHTFDGQRSFINWFLRIVQHAYLDRRRRANPIRNAESLSILSNSPQSSEQPEVHIVDLSFEPHRAVLSRMTELAIRECLDELPEVYRRTIESCDLNGCTYAEIAELTNTTVGTVRSRIHRGRKLLRAALVSRGFVSLMGQV